MVKVTKEREISKIFLISRSLKMMEISRLDIRMVQLIILAKAKFLKKDQVEKVVRVCHPMKLLEVVRTNTRSLNRSEMTLK